MPQRIDGIVESHRVRELGVQQRHHMSPGAERARLRVDLVLPRQLGHQMAGDEIAHLRQHRQLARAGAGFLTGLFSSPDR
jgi:hypothetical protein